MRDFHPLRMFTPKRTRDGFHTVPNKARARTDLSLIDSAYAVQPCPQFGPGHDGASYARVRLPRGAWLVDSRKEQVSSHERPSLSRTLPGPRFAARCSPEG